MVKKVRRIGIAVMGILAFVLSGCDQSELPGSANGETNEPPKPAVYDAGGVWTLRTKSFAENARALSLIDETIVTISQTKDKAELIDNAGRLFQGAVDGNSYKFAASWGGGDGTVEVTYALTLESETRLAGTKTVRRSGGSDLLDMQYGLTGEKAPAGPAVDPNGTWVVRSFQDNEIRSGIVLLEMAPDGALTGKAELTSLPGESIMTGRLDGHTMTLMLESPFGVMRTTGTVSESGNKVTGKFAIEGIDNEVSWWGEKEPVGNFGAQKGNYTIDEDRNLTMNFTASDIMENFQPFTVNYKILIISANTMVWSNGEEMVWTRDKADPDVISGTWSYTERGILNEVSFSEDGTFVLEVSPMRQGVTL